MQNWGKFLREGPISFETESSYLCAFSHFILYYTKIDEVYIYL